MTSRAAPIASLSHARRFLLGGHATFTLVSKKTGERRTFQVEACPEQQDPANPRFFVRLLTRPDEYSYMGLLIDGVEMKLVGVKMGDGSPAVQAFRWMCSKMDDDHNHPLCPAQSNFDAQAEFWHSGRCSRCNRELTDPASIASGIGPVCAEKGGY